MELRVERKWKKDNYTIGILYVDNKRFCETLEDTDRGLSDDMPLSKIQTLKKAKVTAIPTGTYKVTLNVLSPKYSKKTEYLAINKGYMPRLLNVKGYEGILIHAGNNEHWTDGCILIGENKVKGGLINGIAKFKELHNLLKNQKDITITIK